MEPLEPRPSLPPSIAPAEPARVPRRYGVGTLLLFTLLYALLFGLMQAAGAPVVVPISLAVFFALVGLGQMLLFRGKKPRLASFLVGGVVWCLIALADSVMIWRFQAAPFNVYSVVGAFYFLLIMFLCGGLLGYGAGCLLAGVFLLLKPLEKRRGCADEANPFADTEIDGIHQDQ